MHLRTFHAASIQEAIRQARQELGADAMLLNSRSVQSAEAQAAPGGGGHEDGKSGRKAATATADGGLFAVTFATASPLAQNSTGTTNGMGTSPKEPRRAGKAEDSSGVAGGKRGFESAVTRVGLEGKRGEGAGPPERRVLSQREEPLGYGAALPGPEAVNRNGNSVPADEESGTRADLASPSSRALKQQPVVEMDVTSHDDAGVGAQRSLSGRGGTRRVKAADEENPERALPSYDKLFEQMTSMRREMLQLAGTVRRAGADSYRQELPAEELRWAYDALVAQEFYSDLIEDVIEELSPRYDAVTGEASGSQAAARTSSGKSRGRKRSVRKAEQHPSQDILPVLREALAQRIDLAAEPGLRRRSSKPQLVVLVGPPGVGKTTTLVKLAARYGASSRFPLQIVSMDNYRVGASEQLRTYASILGVGFDALPSAAALQKALASYQAKELILIDTPGYGWRDFPAASDLAALLRAEPQTTIHLTVSASMKPSDLARVADLYEVFDYDSLLFTKIDETATIGPMVSESVLRRKQLSYFCAGQRIPDDLEVASRERLLARMLPETSASDEFAA